MKVGDIVYYVHKRGNETALYHGVSGSMMENYKKKIPLVIESFNSMGSAECKRKDGTGSTLLYSRDDLILPSKDESFLSSLFEGG